MIVRERDELLETQVAIEELQEAGRGYSNIGQHG